MGTLYHLNVGCADASIIKTSSATFLINCYNIEDYAHLLPSKTTRRRKSIEPTWMALVNGHFKRILASRIHLSAYFRVGFLFCFILTPPLAESARYKGH